jgi:mitochondrial-processing peptidase subunit alpha
VSISIAINSGSKYESAKEKGAAHLLAAAGFSGTQERSGLRLMRDIENAGFIVDATATREQIIYSIKALPDAADAAISTLSEAVFSAPVHEYIVSLFLLCL